MDECHRAGPRIRPRTGATRAQVALDLIEEDAQGGIEGLAVMLKVVAQALWKRQDPLAHRQRGQDVVHEVGRALGHSPGIARGADAAAFAGEGDQEIVAALLAPRSRKAVGQNATLQVPPQFPLGVRRDALVLPVVPAQRKEGLEVVLHRPVER